MANDSNFTLSVEIDTKDIESKIEVLKNMFKDIEININPLKDEMEAIDNATKPIKKALTVGDSDAGALVGAETEAQQKRDKERQDKERSRAKTFGEIKGSLMRQLGLIAGIAGSIAMIVQASPILQNSLTMIINTITLLIRPIGDVIGLLLRPLIVLFMHQALVPYIQTIYPWIIRFASFWDSTVQEFFKNPAGFLATLGSDDGIADTTGQTEYENYGGRFDFAEEWKNKFVNFFRTIYLPLDALISVVGYLEQGFDTLKRTLDLLSIGAFEKLQAFFAVLQDIGENPVKAIEYLSMWARAVIAWLGESETVKNIQDAWNTLVGWFVGMSEWINGSLIESWTSLVTWFTNIKKAVDEVLMEAWLLVEGFFEGMGNGVKIIAEAWAKLYALFVDIRLGITDTIEGAWDRMYNFFKKVGESVGNLTNWWNRVLSTIRSLTGGGGSNRNAAGGIIREHVVGFGQRSGQMYEFGEQGTEAIVPLTGGGSGEGGASTVNVVINVNGKMTTQEVEALSRTISRQLGNRWTRGSVI